MRKTKIVCTLGPATDNMEILKELLYAGMSVARINFSHGNYKDQEDRICMLKQIRTELNLPVPMLLDTQGPEIRIGKFHDGKIELKDGELFSLIQEELLGDVTKVTVSYKNLCDDIEIGRTVLINDGTIELKVEEINNRDIV
ncbi:MAG: pyruvate kinase, partial [Oscillospiraceae bacterium]|nr:pyruvate kinase [Oscillospiraceae bacterium]